MAVTGAAVFLLTGCAATVSLESAEDAANPECAEVMLMLPNSVGDHQQRSTDSQATSAWGEPTAVTLRCGVPPPPPSTEVCETVNGIDWLIIPEEDEDTDAARGATIWRLVTYGRNPAVEVYIDTEVVASSTLAEALAPAVGQVDQDRQCLSVEDVEE